MSGMWRDAAKLYLQQGWSIVPVSPHGKRPLVPWETFQHRRPLAAEVDGWLERWPDANLAIVTGAVSDLVVVDIDQVQGGEISLGHLEAAFDLLPATLEAGTGGGGRHLYFKHPGGTVPNRSGLRPGLDVRGDGGYVVAPPSIHMTGRPYLWTEYAGPEDCAPTPLPGWLLRLILGQGRPSPRASTRWRELVQDGLQRRQRDTTLASLTGHLLRRGVDPDIVAELLQSWNTTRCRPPLPADEVERAIADIRDKRERHQRRVKQAA